MNIEHVRLIIKLCMCIKILKDQWFLLMLNNS